MKPFICNRKKFETFADAVAYANKYHEKTGGVLGIERQTLKPSGVALDKTGKK